MMDDPIITSSWSWDVSGSWNSLCNRLSRNCRAVPQQVQQRESSKQLPARCTYTSSQIFFVYDLQKCMSEASDPDDGIIYFYPQQADAVDRCHLCLQLVGMAHFFKESFSAPEVVTTASAKYVLRKLESYVLVLSGARDLHTYILQQQIDFILNMFKFYHKDVRTLKEACFTDQHFLRSQKEFWQCSLSISRSFEDKLSRMFRAVPVLKLPEGASAIYAKGYKILQMFQKQEAVLAGSIFYKNKVLASQLTPEVTQLVQLAAVTNSRFAMQDAELYNNLPAGTQLVYIYVSRHTLTKLKEINVQSSRETGLHEDRDQQESSTESVASCIIKPSTSMETPDSGHKTEAKSGCESACISPMQSLPPSTQGSQKSVQAGRQGIVDSDFISDFDSEKDFNVKTVQLSPHILELKRLTDECLRVSEERMRKQQLKKRMRQKRRKLPRKAVSLQVSSQDAGANLNLCRKVPPSRNNTTENCFDTNPLAFILGQQEGFPSLYHEDVSACYSGVHDCVNNSETGDSTTLSKSHVSMIGKALSNLKNFGLAVRNLRLRTVTNPASLTTSSEKHLGSVNIVDDELNVKTADEALTYRFDDLPPVVPFQFLAMTDDPPASSSAQDLKPHRERSTGAIHQASSQTLHSKLTGVSKRSRKASGHASMLQRSTGAELGDDVCRLLLYVQKHCQMVCMALLEHGDKVDEALITTLWSVGLDQLGSIEAEIRGCPQRQRDPGSVDDTTLLFNKQLCTFGDTPSVVWCEQPYRARALGSLHGDMIENRNMHTLSIRSTREWIKGAQTDVRETYKVEKDSTAPQFLSPEQLPKNLNIY